MSEVREHIAYMDEMGNPEECTEDCPGCHWEGNRSCEALASGCDICDPDAVYAYAPENAERLRQVRALLDEWERSEPGNGLLAVMGLRRVLRDGGER